MPELWIAHHSLQPWSEPAIWSAYFEQVQLLLKAPLTHLDVNDPVKRKVASLADAADYVSAFKPRDDSRWVFGKCGVSGIEVSIQHYRRQESYPNTIKWHLPLSLIEDPENRRQLRHLFDLGNRSFRPFYGYSDDVAQIASKKKPSGAVNIQAELLGVFWLTYFNLAYVRYFGKENIDRIPGVDYWSDGSATIVLAETPKSVTSEWRELVMTILGRRSFVDLNDHLLKPPGRFALTFHQLNTQH